MAGNKYNTRPSEKEVEVSLFGPGYGESLLLHLGQQFWVVIDSCLSRPSKEPAALKYLKDIGIDPSETIRLVIATMWNDDHVRGLGDVFRSSIRSKFVCSGALRSTEFRELVLMSDSLMSKEPGLREFKEIMEILKDRRTPAKMAAIGPEFALAGQVLHRRSAGLPFEIQALSPSSAALTLAYNEISTLIPTFKTPKRSVVARTPNHVAVALWVNVGGLSILLGSDLEETNDPATGWTVIVDSTTRLPGKAETFKVPHHGSADASQPRVWDEMVSERPIAILTPLNAGKNHLPSKSEAGTILSRTEHAFISAQVKAKKTRWKDRTVDKMVREIVRRIQEVPGPMGHIRLRRDPLSSYEREWRVELFGAACHLKQAHPA